MKYNSWKSDYDALQADPSEQYAQGRIGSERQDLEKCVAQARARDAAETAEQERRRADEAERKERADAAFHERQAKIASLAADKRILSAAWSADFCVAKQARVAALQEIRTQQRYAREGGGVVDMAQLHALQEKMRQEDDRMADARGMAKELKIKMRSCSDPAVAELMNCLDDDGNATCEDLRVQVLFEQPKERPRDADADRAATLRRLIEDSKHPLPAAPDDGPKVLR